MPLSNTSINSSSDILAAFSIAGLLPRHPIHFVVTKVSPLAASPAGSVLGSPAGSKLASEDGSVLGSPAGSELASEDGSVLASEDGSAVSAAVSWS